MQRKYKMYTIVYAVPHPLKEDAEIICTQHLNSKHMSGAIRQAVQNETRNVIRIIRACERV